MALGRCEKLYAVNKQTNKYMNTWIQMCIYIYIYLSLSLSLFLSLSLSTHVSLYLPSLPHVLKKEPVAIPRAFCPPRRSALAMSQALHSHPPIVTVTRHRSYRIHLQAPVHKSKYVQYFYILFSLALLIWSLSSLAISLSLSLSMCGMVQKNQILFFPATSPVAD